ncbi:MAG: undecaprenyl/decaprenyl-phosphate alpha-N-acetylglucosaminyl 1-phosphate transferase, partial [Gammaproteobacteria bacterium]|nr:undecaprenyl/decaprenyl-phosphate alpha-N-acetylglucosaminyl 1-phosphate transferase [Gammaproteobacteria bacterium]
IAGIYILKPAASRYGLVDRPDGRKQHTFHTPLIGGITIFLAFVLFLASFFFFPSPGLNHPALIVSTALIMATGMIDDYLQLGVRLRFALHALVALIMILWGGVVLVDLGYLVSSNLLLLGYLSIPFTVFATLGTINALNMLDGVDGLAGALSVVTFSFIALLSFTADSIHYSNISIAVLGALLGFLVFNFPHRSRLHATVFLGDAGSNLLGCILAWLFIALSQGENPVIAPVTALWLYAVPLFDTVSVMIRRIWLKKSPFKADRGHLHHLLVDAGFRVRQVVHLMVLLQMLLAGIGVWMLWKGVPQAIGFFGFLGLFALYLLLISRTWRAIPQLRRIHRALGLTVAGARSVYVGNLNPAHAESMISALLDEFDSDRRYSLHGYHCAVSGEKRVCA